MKSSCFKVPNIESIHRTIEVLSSKSHSIRALFLAALQPYETIVEDVTFSDDVESVINVIETMGATVMRAENKVSVRGVAGHVNGGTYPCGESGLCVRIAAIISILADSEVHITGHGTVLNRRFEETTTLLLSLGLQVESNDHRLPLTISGNIHMTNIEVDASDTSQVVTGLLLVLPFLPSGTTLTVHHLVSTPYVELTKRVLEQFQIHCNEAVVNGKRRFVIDKTALSPAVPMVISAFPDWSGLAFWMVAAAIGGTIRFDGLHCREQHTDAIILEVLKEAGANIHHEQCDVIVERNRITSFHVDATHYPDLFPPLVVLALWGTEKSSIKGVHRLQNKESNRAEALVAEFRKLGADIIIQDDTMYIRPSTLKGGVSAHSHHDHRIAMALSIAGLFLKEEICVERAEVVSKSYPAFFEELRKIGV